MKQKTAGRNKHGDGINTIKNVRQPLYRVASLTTNPGPVGRVVYNVKWNSQVGQLYPIKPEPTKFNTCCHTRQPLLGPYSSQTNARY